MQDAFKAHIRAEWVARVELMDSNPQLNQGKCMCEIRERQRERGLITQRILCNE